MPELDPDQLSPTAILSQIDGKLAAMESRLGERLATLESAVARGLEHAGGTAATPRRNDGGLSAGDLYSVFAELGKHAERWTECDLIVCCASTYAGVKSLFPAAELLVAAPAKPWDLMVVEQLGMRAFEMIGIASPWVLRDMYESGRALCPLVQRCRKGLLFLVGDELDDEAKRLRCLLHRIGYYEVALLGESLRVDCSSVGVSADGDFDFRGSQPGLPRSGGKWLTHLASRAAICSDEIHAWRGVFGCPRIGSRGDAGLGPDEMALMVRDVSSSGRTSETIAIEAVARWRDSHLAGHVALVACYGGPGDCNMYAAHVESATDGAAFLSLWRNDGAWIRLVAIAVPSERVERANGNFCLRFWLKVTADAVLAGSEADILAIVQDSKLPRLHTCGIRLVGERISMSEVVVDLPAADRA